MDAECGAGVSRSRLAGGSVAPEVTDQWHSAVVGCWRRSELAASSVAPRSRDLRVVGPEVVWLAQWCQGSRVPVPSVVVGRRSVLRWARWCRRPFAWWFLALVPSSWSFSLCARADELWPALLLLPSSGGTLPLLQMCQKT